MIKLLPFMHRIEIMGVPSYTFEKEQF